MDVPAGAGFGGVHVGVGIQPNQSDPLAARAVVMRYAAHRTNGHGMVAAQHQRHAAAPQRLLHCLRQPLARGGDLRQVLGVRLANR